MKHTQFSPKAPLSPDIKSMMLESRHKHAHAHAHAHAHVRTHSHTLLMGPFHGPGPASQFGNSYFCTVVIMDPWKMHEEVMSTFV